MYRFRFILTWILQHVSSTVRSSKLCNTVISDSLSLSDSHLQRNIVLCTRNMPRKLKWKILKKRSYLEEVNRGPQEQKMVKLGCQYDLRAQETILTAHKVGRTVCRLFLYYFLCVSNSSGFRGSHTFGFFRAFRVSLNIFSCPTLKGGPLFSC